MERNIVLYIAKGFGIISSVFSHLTISSNYKEIIYIYLMFLFFLLHPVIYLKKEKMLN